jgi:hypothetical protein
MCTRMIPLLRTLLLAPLLMAGCDTTLAPGTFQGAYALNGTPGLVMEAQTLTMEVIADTLWIAGDRTAQRRFRGTSTLRDGSLRSEQDWTATYRYVRRGNRIEMTQICPPNALCVAGPHLTGRLRGETLELRELWAPQVLTYERFSR